MITQHCHGTSCHPQSTPQWPATCHKSLARPVQIQIAKSTDPKVRLLTLFTMHKSIFFLIKMHVEHKAMIRSEKG